jgi:prepilin-type N-terminal cleavage/methylation domain-containing protein
VSGVRARGVTLIELLLAITVLAVGALAVAATAAPLARLVRWGGAQSASAAAAGAVIEKLRAAGCAALAPGAATRGGLSLGWQAAPGGRLRAVTVAATYPWGAGSHRDVYETAVACPP